MHNTVRLAFLIFFISFALGQTYNWVQFASYEDDATCSGEVTSYVVYDLDSCTYQDDTNNASFTYLAFSCDSNTASFLACSDSSCNNCAPQGYTIPTGSCYGDSGDGVKATCLESVQDSNYEYDSGITVKILSFADSRSCSTSPYAMQYYQISDQCDQGSYYACNDGTFVAYSCADNNCNSNCYSYPYGCTPASDTSLSFSSAYECLSGSDSGSSAGSVLVAAPFVAYAALALFL